MSWSARKELAVLILTEDRGSDGGSAFATVTAITKKLLQQVDPDCNTHRINFTPANDDARKLLAGNNFNSHEKDARHFRLYQLIAAQLRLEDGFVVHHFDSDCTWQERDRSAPLDAKPVQREILGHVRELLRAPPSTRARRRDVAPPPLTDAAIDAMLARYLRLVPYREIEAWLYQNTTRALGFACKRPQCGCTERLEQWRTDRALLDEHPDPPAALPCVGKRHNSELIEGFPTAEVYAAGKSLAATVDAMFECGALLDAIERTHRQPAPDPPAA